MQYLHSSKVEWRSFNSQLQSQFPQFSVPSFLSPVHRPTVARRWVQRRRKWRWIPLWNGDGSLLFRHPLRNSRSAPKGDCSHEHSVLNSKRLSTLIGLHKAYPFDALFYFYREALADAQTLFNPIPPIDEASYAQVRRDLNIQRNAVAKNVPRKKNSEGVSAMRQEVSAAKAEPVHTTTHIPLPKS